MLRAQAQRLIENINARIEAYSNALGETDRLIDDGLESFSRAEIGWRNTDAAASRAALAQIDEVVESLAAICHDRLPRRRGSRAGPIDHGQRAYPLTRAVGGCGVTSSCSG